MPARQCGECTLCCRLLPVRTLGKGANERCRHQRHTGCRVYQSQDMPPECQLWNCRWLLGEAGKTGRPDRTHYVLDMMPDFITAKDNETGEEQNAEVIQIWVDPRYPDAWRDPDLLAYLSMKGEEGKAALIRYSSSDAFVLIPPAFADDGQFHEMRDGHRTYRTHSPAEIAEALSNLP